MNRKSKTLKELKEICKKNNLKNYSKLDKNNLIKFIKKNIKGGTLDGTLTNENLIDLKEKLQTELMERFQY